MSGINRHTGGELDGWEHCRQSLYDIWTTPKGTRVMRRDYGAGLLDLIDRPATPDLIMDALLSIAETEVWEPRFRVRQLGIESAGPDGVFEIVFDGIYFPRGHLGDYSTYAWREGERIRL